MRKFFLGRDFNMFALVHPAMYEIPIWILIQWKAFFRIVIAEKIWTIWVLFDEH